MSSHAETEQKPIYIETILPRIIVSGRNFQLSETMGNFNETVKGEDANRL